MKVRAALALVILVAHFGVVTAADPKPDHDDPESPVGADDRARIILPVDQILTPAGRQIELPKMRPQVLRLSPDGKILATSGKTSELVIIDSATAAILQRVPLPSDKLRPGPAVSPNILKPDTDAQVSYTGLAFSADGSRLYLSNVDGDIKVFAIDAAHKVTGLHSLPLPPNNMPGRSHDIPAGLALSADGKRLFVALNYSNRLAEIDTETGKTLHLADVGFAPFDVAVVGEKVYVSNWGGRRPDKDSLTGPVGNGPRVRVDPVKHIADEGSVTVVDFAAGRVVTETLTGSHASALAVSPDSKYVVVANTGADSLSVIGTTTDRVIENIDIRGAAPELLGTNPNAMCFDPTGKTLFVCTGTQNAVAVIDFDPGHSKIRGLLPTGWFPGAIAYDAHRKAVAVANIKGIGSWSEPDAGKKPKRQTHQHYGSLSLIDIPADEQLKASTEKVLQNNRRAAALAAQFAPRPGVAPRALPERSGEPSTIKHVIYIIKENRTYDQVLGDIPEGRGEPSLCIFGQKVTPNQHKIAKEFVLLDNTYCSGVLSADGHQWADAGFVTDYLERSFAGFPRSYPDGFGGKDIDALASSPAGYIWDNAIAHKVSIRVYGEFATDDSGWADPKRKGSPHWRDHYKDFLKGTHETRMAAQPSIESLRPYLVTDYPGWEPAITDVARAARFIKDLKDAEKTGELPQLMIVGLINDHTAGTKENLPTPAAMVADNDLAMGRIVEAISHSKFWKDTVLISIEDDPQNGWDHIDGYRTTAYIAGASVKRHFVNHTRYDQPGLLRTIELILGLPPMNQIDAAARPMAECFLDEPDLTPFDAVPNIIPLDQLNPGSHAIADPEQRKFAEISNKLNFSVPDACPEDTLNRILWHAQKGAATYPVWAIHEHDDDDDDDKR